MKAPLRRLVAGLCAALLLAAPAGAQEATGKAANNQAVAAYQAALTREKALLATLQRATAQAEHAAQARRNAESLQWRFDAARTALANRRDALSAGRRHILALQQGERALATAIEADARLADAALQAAQDNAAAGNDRERVARLADAAAERQHAQAEAVSEIAGQVERLASDWRSAGDSVRRHQESYLELSASLMPTLADLRSSISDLAAAPGTGRNPALQKRQAELARAAAAVQRQFAVLWPPTAAQQPAAPLVPGDREVHPAPGPAWAAAELDRQIEAQALAWRHALLRSCGSDTECRTRTAGEAGHAERQLQETAAAARARQEATRNEIGQLDAVAAQWAELAAQSDAARKRLDSAAAPVERLLATAQATEQIARAGAGKAEQDYRTARESADKAYFAAYERERRDSEMAMYKSAPATASRPALAAAGAPRVTMHAFQPVTRENLRRMPDYGAYTYVIFAQRPDLAAQPVQQNYEALLQAIVAGTPHIDALKDAPPKAINIFCIPSLARTMADRNRYDIKAYDADLGLALLATAGRGSIINPAILGRLRNSPGPFLLTTFKPLDQVASSDPLFFVDLAPYGRDSYPALVASYKEQILVAPPASPTLWKPEMLQWAFAVGATLYTDGKKVADGVRKLFEDWIKGQGTKVALVGPAQ